MTLKKNSKLVRMHKSLWTVALPLCWCQWMTWTNSWSFYKTKTLIVNMIRLYQLAGVTLKLNSLTWYSILTVQNITYLQNRMFSKQAFYQFVFSKSCLMKLLHNGFLVLISSKIIIQSLIKIKCKLALRSVKLPFQGLLSITLRKKEKRSQMQLKPWSLSQMLWKLRENQMLLFTFKQLSLCYSL